MKKSLQMFFVLLCLCAAGSVKAQLWVDTTNYTANQMISDFFNTASAQVSNITYTGAPGSMCFFEGSQSNIGLNAGILVTTGGFQYATGPNDQFSAGLLMGTPGDNDLEGLIPGYFTNDASVIEFDVVPSTDTIAFQYVFGSEEYPEYVGTSFNDVFAFFITGGTEYPTLHNIAMVPGTDIPVSVNNVNDTTNQTFYVDNTAGTTVQYDGFTTPIQAIASVTPGVTYHVKIGVADAGDSVFDSGVFLSVQSLGGDSLLAPQPEFLVSANGNTVTFGDQSRYATSWHWDFGDGNTSDVRNPVHTFAQDLTTHQYTVSLTTANYCCSQTVSYPVGQTVSGVSNLTDDNFRLSPNPGNGRLLINCPGNLDVQLLLSDMNGQVLRQTTVRNGQWVDWSDLGAGVYFARITGDGQSLVRKVIIK